MKLQIVFLLEVTQNSESKRHLTQEWIKLSRFSPTDQAVDFILKNASKNRCDNSRRSISRQTTSERGSQSECLSFISSTCFTFTAYNSPLLGRAIFSMCKPKRLSSSICHFIHPTAVLCKYLAALMLLLYLVPNKSVNCSCSKQMLKISVLQVPGSTAFLQRRADAHRETLTIAVSATKDSSLLGRPKMFQF